MRYILSRSVLFCSVTCFAFTMNLGATRPVDADESVYDPERFEKSVVASNLVQPMEMAIAPDGSIFIIELGGEIKRVDPSKSTIETIGKVTVTTAQENGLIGIALDPQFASNGWLYLQYSPPDFTGQRISRFSLKDGKLDLGSESPILSYEEQRQECCHHAGSMEFGPDGNLYIGTGDNTNPFGDSGGFAPIDERQDKSAFSALRTSANTKSFNGKVLRIRPLPEGGYAIPDGNLFPRDGKVGLPEIYVMGCRNPWRLNIDRKTGFLYWGDVGPDAGGDGPRGPRGYDEVNQAKRAGNYGWPLFIANNKPYVRYDFVTQAFGEPFDPAVPLNESRFNQGARELPPAQPAWIYYPGGNSTEFPELGSGGRTACAGPSYDFDPNLQSDTKFPKDFDRCLFIFEWSRNWIAAVHLHPDSSIQRIEPFLPKVPFVRPIDMQFDAHGSLYVIEYGETWGVNPDAKLVRLDYRRGNRSPSVQIQSDLVAGREPLSVQLTSVGTLDKDRDQLSYRWSISKATLQTNESSHHPQENVLATAHDTSFEKIVSDQPSTRVEFDEAGVYNVRLQVYDRHGGSGHASLSVVVGNSVPEVQFRHPKAGDFYVPGEPISYSLVVRDQEDGTSDADEAELPGWEFIDLDAPKRVSLQANLIASSSKEDLDSAPSGLKRIRSSDCLNCHALNRPLVGPSFLDVANKYRDQPKEFDNSVQRVAKGSSGVWGKVPMLPHSQHTIEEIRDMVQWVYALKPDPSSEMRTGMSNKVELLTTKADFEGLVRMTASYLDLGRDSIPSLSGSCTIELRSRVVQGENASMIHDMQILGSHKAGQGKFCGAINHGSYLRVDQVPLGQFSKITANVTSAGAGGWIDVRVGSIDGPSIARLPVRVNGDWDGWYTETANVSKLENSLDRADLYFVCVNDQQRGGLMNIDWLRFDP